MLDGNLLLIYANIQIAYTFHPFCFNSLLVVNTTDELGPLKELLLLANETSITLDNLKYSTRYKFYLNAMTVKGSGPTITEEAVTIMDEGED